MQLNEVRKESLGAPGGGCAVCFVRLGVLSSSPPNQKGDTVHSSAAMVFKRECSVELAPKW